MKCARELKQQGLGKRFADAGIESPVGVQVRIHHAIELLTNQFTCAS